MIQYVLLYMQAKRCYYVFVKVTIIGIPVIAPPTIRTNNEISAWVIIVPIVIGIVVINLIVIPLYFVSPPFIITFLCLKFICYDQLGFFKLKKVDKEDQEELEELTQYGDILDIQTSEPEASEL